MWRQQPHCTLPRSRPQTMMPASPGDPAPALLEAAPAYAALGIAFESSPEAQQ